MNYDSPNGQYLNVKINNEDCIINHHNTAVPGPLKLGAVSLNLSITPIPSNVCTKRTSLKLHGQVQVPHTMVKYRCFIRTFYIT